MPINVYKTDKQIVKVQSTGPQGPRGEQGVSGSVGTLPTGLVSGSSQIDFNGLNNKPSNLFSSSQQLPIGIISSSNQLPSGLISSSIQINDTILDYLSFTGSDGYSFKKLSTLVDYTNFIGQYQDNSNFSGMFHNYSTDGQLTYGTTFSGDNIATSFFIDKYGIIYQQSSGSVVNGFNIYDVGLNLSANNNNTNILLNNIGIFVTSVNGITYNDDYSSTIKSNDRSIPDVGTIRNELTASYALNGRPYKVYTANIVQNGTANPVVTVLENTTGLNLEWKRVITGIYEATASNASIPFANSSSIYLSVGNALPSNFYNTIWVAEQNIIRIQSFNSSGTNRDISNSGLVPFSMEMRIYNI